MMITFAASWAMHSLRRPVRVTLITGLANRADHELGISPEVTRLRAIWRFQVFKLQVSNSRFQVSGYKFQVTSHKLLIFILAKFYPEADTTYPYKSCLALRYFSRSERGNNPWITVSDKASCNCCSGMILHTVCQLKPLIIRMYRLVSVNPLTDSLSFFNMDKASCRVTGWSHNTLLRWFSFSSSV